MSSLAPYYQPTFERETDQEAKHVFTWLRIWEWNLDCVYDTEFGHWVAKEDLEAYSKSFDFSNEEQEEFLKTLKKKI